MTHLHHRAAGRQAAGSPVHAGRAGPAVTTEAARGPAAVRQGAGAPRNVDAASFAEDVTPPAGVQADGQSETSIAASGPYVAEAWNDATGFFAPCPSPMAKEEGTGFGFSANGGKSFADLGGLPNARCHKDLYEGDPSVAAYRVGGSTYFYFSSLFDSPTGLGLSRSPWTPARWRAPDPAPR